MITEPQKCLCGCGHPVKPGNTYFDRRHSNRRKDKPKQTAKKHRKTCGNGRAGLQQAI